jgi:hypothetical protein
MLLPKNCENKKKRVFHEIKFRGKDNFSWVSLDK